MGAGISSMSADVATPPTSEWQALASSFSSDSSATLISRLLLLFIFITIPACGLHLHMRKRSSVSDDGPTGEEPPEEIEMNDMHSAEAPSSFTDALAATFSAANTELLDEVSIAMNASS
ncbi:hypothetical protein CY35_12G007900 [Sphagnum magellanicum]|nr:hypothetical protein CY35_12G007900 [Sphagnum magellanicum]